MPGRFPERIVCLTEETTEVIYLLGEQDRIVGISGYTVRPPQARQKPKVSAFINAKFDKIIELSPDLVLAFSDLQADIAAELIRRGCYVFTFNQRTVEQILDMILTLGRLLDRKEKAETLVASYLKDFELIRSSAERFKFRPRVLFEEWDEPLISGIAWVEELLEIAGAQPIFPELRSMKSARDRIVDPATVIERDPQVIIASWCGRPVKKPRISARKGWDQITAVKNDDIYEIKSTYILQPGPAALTEGLRQLHFILAHVQGLDVSPHLLPQESIDKKLQVAKSTNQ
ncbi:MAG: cobalamin-binding protein [Acidobacteriota bacterium]|nr:cobalamin-binding protein [Blastocatellia bacterium]MDW8411731.1 cobalamin-binding protein [Acidobacteriota bacterium]